MMAKVMMADELTKLQDVYLLAVTRHVILQREVDAYMASTTSSSSGDAGEAVEEQALRQTRSRVSRSRRREKMEDRRERLLAAAAREAPPVAFENPGQGNPMGVRCVKIRVWHLACGYDSVCERNRSDTRFCITRCLWGYMRTLRGQSAVLPDLLGGCDRVLHHKVGVFFPRGGCTWASGASKSGCGI